MKRRVLLGILFTFLLVNFAFAVNVYVKETPIKSEGYPGERLSYNLTFFNREANEVKIGLNFLFASASFSENPVVLSPGQQKTIQMSFIIPITSKPGYTYQKVLLFDENGNYIPLDLFIPVKVLDVGASYASAEVKEFSTSPENIDPRQSFDISFKVYNPSKSVSTLVKVTSDFFNFQDTFEIPEGEKEISFVGLKLPNDTLPGDYPVTVYVNFPNRVISKNFTLHVIGYSTCEISKEVKSGFLTKTVYFYVENKGTSEGKCSVSDEISSLSSLLLSSATQGYSLKGGKISWAVTLPPGSKETVYYEINYTSLVVAPFVAIFAVYLVWYFSRDIEVKKELVEVKSRPGYNDFKIQIRVKNLTSKDLEHVKVKDELPAVVKEIREYGVIPGKVKSRGKKKYVEWLIDDLKAKEEVVLSYKFRTTVEIVGKAVFGPAKVEYKKDDKKKEVSSNIIVVEME